MTTAAQLAGMTDNALDTAFATSWDARNYAVAQMYADEIRTRLISPVAFLQGVFGYARFPLYDARNEQVGSYTQVQAAQTSTAAAAQNIGATISDAANVVVDTVGGIGKTVAVVAVAAVVLVIFLKVKE